MMRTTLSLISSLVIAGIAFIVLYPILGVTLWVSLLVAGCLLVFGSVTSRTALH